MLGVCLAGGTPYTMPGACLAGGTPLYHAGCMFWQGGPPQSPQVLIIPPDATRWQALQKSLIVGGVYHVMVHTGQRKYCLWNGTQLVPCTLQLGFGLDACNVLQFIICFKSCFMH